MSCNHRISFFVEARSKYHAPAMPVIETGGYKQRLNNCHGQTKVLHRGMPTTNHERTMPIRLQQVGSLCRFWPKMILTACYQRLSPEWKHLHAGAFMKAQWHMKALWNQTSLC